MAEQIFMKLGTYIMAPELISTVYFINISHQFVCYATVRQKCYRSKKYASDNRKIVGRFFFYAVRLISKKLGD
jgi:hypothetical protein